MTRDNLNVFKLSPVKLPPGIVWPCQAAESPGNKADPVAICMGKSSNLLDHILGWSRSTSWTLSDTLQNCFGFWASASAVMLLKQCYKPAMFWWVFYPGWWMLLLYEYWFGRQSGLGYHASNAPQVNWQAVSQWRIHSIYRVFFSMRSVTCFWNHFPLWKFLNNMSLSTSNTKVEHDSIDSCISNGFAAMSKAITFHCQAVSLEDGTTQWPPHVCTCKTDAATESSMQNDPWSNHPATAPWIFFPILHPHPLWSTLIHSDPLRVRWNRQPVVRWANATSNTQGQRRPQSGWHERFQRQQKNVCSTPKRQ